MVRKLAGMGSSMKRLYMISLPLAVGLICAASASVSQSQPKPFDETAYKNIMGDMKGAMSAWHAGLIARTQTVADDVIVEALNFYTYGDPSGPGTIVSPFKTMDTGWKNSGSCVYQRVLTQYNDEKNSSYTIRGRSALITLDLKKIDWNSSTVKSDYNTLTNSRFYRVSLAGRSNEFYSELTNFVSAGDAASRRLIMGNVESTATYEAGSVEAPLDRIQKSLSLAKAQCAGIKSSF